MAGSAKTDPFPSFNFKLSTNTDMDAHFVECSGLNVKINTIQYREAGLTETRKVPGPVEYGDITLRYGVTTSKALWEWFMKGAEGKVDGLRRNVTIELLKSDRSGEAVRWNLFDAWISEWRGARLDAMGKEIAIESITLVFDKLERA